MTEKIKETIAVPRWIVILFVTSIISLFTLGWKKIDNIENDLTIEKTSRIYIEKKLESIDKKLDKVLEHLPKKP